MDWAKTTARRDEKRLCLGSGASYIRELTVVYTKVPTDPIGDNDLLLSNFIYGMAIQYIVYYGYFGI